MQRLNDTAATTGVPDQPPVADALAPPLPAVVDEHGRRSWPLIAAIVLALGAYVVYMALGMPGMDHGAATADHTAMRRVVPAAEFEALIADRSTWVVNVHVPNEGNIPGTDVRMPFNDLDRTNLPTDPSTPIYLYCQTGSMSQQAAGSLMSMGYTNVVELDGGTEAWEASGRALIEP